MHLLWLARVGRHELLPFVQQAGTKPMGRVRRIAAFRDQSIAVQALAALLERCATHKMRNGLRSLVAERRRPVTTHGGPYPRDDV